MGVARDPGMRGVAYLVDQYQFTPAGRIPLTLHRGRQEIRNQPPSAFRQGFPSNHIFTVNKTPPNI